MMRLTFGALLALLVLYPTLAAAALTLAAHPAVLAFAAGVWAWPRIADRIRGWAR